MAKTAAAIPIEAAERVKELGYRIRLARTRRGMSIPDLATKVGIHRKTLQALELGRASITVGVYATVLWALGLDRTLDAVAHPDADIHGKTLEASRRPARVRKSQQKSKNEYDF
jgi:transcriptional regulator with XRE-family HTH domain